MDTRPTPLLPQLLARIPHELLATFRMEGEGGGAPGDSGQGAAGAGGAPAGGDRTFTQAELDRIVQDRVARAKPADYDDLKTKAQRLEELEAQAMSDQEKAVKKAREEAEASARTDERGKWSQRIVSAEVRALAGGKLADPADAVSMIDISQFKVDDNGNVDPKVVAAAIDDLLKAKPYLAAGPVPPAGGRRAPDLRQGAVGSGGAGKPDPDAWIRSAATSRRL